MSDFFISDLHFGHENCMAYDNRQFASIEEHDKAIIDNWNDVVNITDHTYILGDVSWYNTTKTIELLEQLNGDKTLIVGNHDERFLKNKKFRDCFREITHYKKLKLDNGNNLVLCHYCIPDFDGHYYGDWHLFGHTHNTWEHNLMMYIKYIMDTKYEKLCNMVNVGIMMDYMEFRPKTFEEIANVNE